MKPGGGRSKGSGFEREIAKAVIEAFQVYDPSIGIEDCYRTPMSGGHRAARKQDPGDLVMSSRLAKLFPVHVECKKQQSLEVFHFFDDLKKPSWGAPNWIRQAEEASGRNTAGFPMVVMSKNNHPVLCCYPRTGLKRVHPGLHQHFEDMDYVSFQKFPFYFDKKWWFLCRFEDFLRETVNYHVDNTPRSPENKPR